MLLILLGKLINVNKGRGSKMVSWIEDTRTTRVTPEQLQPLGLTLNETSTEAIIAIHCCMRANVDAASKKAIIDFKEGADAL